MNCPFCLYGFDWTLLIDCIVFTSFRYAMIRITAKAEIHGDTQNGQDRQYDQELDPFC